MKKNKLILNSNEIVDILGIEYKKIGSIISDRVGIINAILERNELMEYGFHMYQCLSADTSLLYNLDRNVTSGGLGVSNLKKDAILGCLGEAIERYCMTFVPKTEIIKSKLNDLDKDYSFSKFYTYDDNQYKKNKDRFSNPLCDEVHWTKINSILNKNDYKYWPASLIYLPFNYSKPISENSSTGMAAGFKLSDCIKSGLLELIERDALMINFLKRLNPPEIKIDTILGYNRELIDKMDKNYNVKIYKLYSDINIPIYLSIIWKGKKNNLHYGIGACAHFDSDIAINKSLKECLFTYFYSNHFMDLRKTKIKEINTLYEHFLYYQKDNFDKLLFKSNKISYEKENVSYKSLLKNLKANGIDVYYKNLTTKDVIKTNFKVVKVVAPGLVDLNKSHILPRLGADRLSSVPKKLGIRCIKGISIYPHPFP